MVVCPDCKGSGRYVGFLSEEVCQTCEGSGVHLDTANATHNTSERFIARSVIATKHRTHQDVIQQACNSLIYEAESFYQKRGYHWLTEQDISATFVVALTKLVEHLSGDVESRIEKLFALPAEKVSISLFEEEPLDAEIEELYPHFRIEIAPYEPKIFYATQPIGIK